MYPPNPTQSTLTGSFGYVSNSFSGAASCERAGGTSMKSPLHCSWSSEALYPPAEPCGQLASTCCAELQERVGPLLTTVAAYRPTGRFSIQSYIS
eukprot:4266011-Prymnesium_polylepis.4